MATTRILLPLALLAALGVAGCSGDDGDRGAVGAAGTACWDLNENGVGDPEEDRNGDGVVDVLDCNAPLPGTNIVVSGKVTTDAGVLDQFVSVFFVPTGAVPAAQKAGLPLAKTLPPDAIEADVGFDGSYTATVDAGMYDVLAFRPGYEDEEIAGFDVTADGDNTLDIVLPAIPDGEYISSAQCGVCHTVTYSSFIQTGHPYKITKVIDGQQPVYPFTNLNGVLERVTDEDGQTDNSLGTPQSWSDVSYVIGGYHWKARFMDLDGAIVTGSEVQYNFATDGMVAYHDDEVDKPFNCGNCHTTGWRHQDDALNPARQDDLPFMDGTFAEQGIQCESCHGAGAAHAKFTGTITTDATPRTLLELTAPDAGYGLAVDCGECHTRDGERDYSTYMSGYDNALIAANAPDPRPNEMGGRILASNGLIRHHEQYDEILGIDPDSLDTVRSAGFMATHGNCGTCHYPHGSSVQEGNPLYTGEPGVDHTGESCLTCHGDYAPSLRAGGMQNLECRDCHMPKMIKNAVSYPPVADGAPTTGDISAHVFRINLDSQVYQQFTDDGKFAYPWVTTDWACNTCHNASFIQFPPDVTDGYIFHNNVN